MPLHIAVVHADKAWCARAERALGAEAAVKSFADGLPPVASLEALRPHLVILGASSGPLFEALRGAPSLAKVAILAAVEDEASGQKALTAGADDWVLEAMPVAAFQAKVQALLRLIGRLESGDRRCYAMRGTVGPAGTLPLVKYCEDRRLTGVLTVEATAERRWVEFLGGELAEVGGSPKVPGKDPLDLLLVMKSGNFLIEQAPLDPEALGGTPVKGGGERPGPAGEAAPSFPMPAGRSDVVEVKDETYQVTTDGQNLPNFTITTVIVRDSETVRQTSSSWQHPLRRRQDQDLARSHIDRQHDRVIADLKEMVQAGVSQSPPERKGVSGVDATLLAWAMHFIVEPAWTHLGTVISASLLRRTLDRLGGRHDVLRHFSVTDDARVHVDLTRGPHLPELAVPAVAAWAAAFLAEGQRVVSDVGDIEVKKATLLMSAPLEKIGFYDAFTSARSAARAGRG